MTMMKTILNVFSLVSLVCGDCPQMNDIPIMRYQSNDEDDYDDDDVSGTLMMVWSGLMTMDMLMNPPSPAPGGGRRRGVTTTLTHAMVRPPLLLTTSSTPGAGTWAPSLSRLAALSTCSERAIMRETGNTLLYRQLHHWQYFYLVNQCEVQLRS